MAQAIFEAARDLDVARVLIEVMQEQTGGIAIFERLGFCVEGTFSDHARDRFGSQHHLHMLAYHVTRGPCPQGHAARAGPWLLFAPAPGCDVFRAWRAARHAANRCR